MPLRPNSVTTNDVPVGPFSGTIVDVEEITVPAFDNPAVSEQRIRFNLEVVASNGRSYATRIDCRNVFSSKSKLREVLTWLDPSGLQKAGRDTSAIETLCNSQIGKRVAGQIVLNGKGTGTKVGSMMPALVPSPSAIDSLPSLADKGLEVPNI